MNNGIQYSKQVLYAVFLCVNSSESYTPSGKKQNNPPKI